MFRKLMKNKKAQQTAEYALLIALVVAAIIAMQTYAQRTIQARIRDAAVQLVNRTQNFGTTTQYEPYYLETRYETLRDDTTRQIQDINEARTGPGLSKSLFKVAQNSQRTRVAGGFQSSNYVPPVGNEYKLEGQ